MSRKNKLTDEQRVKAVQEYLAGNGSYGHIARKYGIAYQSLTEMVLRARTEGIDSIKSGKSRNTQPKLEITLYSTTYQEKEVRQKYVQSIGSRAKVFSANGFHGIIVVKTLKSEVAQKEELP